MSEAPRTPDDETRALRVALAESERARVAAETTVQRMEGSISWRITAPLRRAAARARRARGSSGAS